MTEQEIYTYFDNLTKAQNIIKCFHVGYLDDLQGETLDSFYKTGKKKEYPIIVCAPPVSYPLVGDQDGKENFNMSLYFLDTQQTKQNLDRKVLPLPAVWLSMVQVARDYWRQFRKDVYAGSTFNHEIELTDTRPQIDRVRDYGVDQLTGCRLDINFNMFTGCTIMTEFNV